MDSRRVLIISPWIYNFINWYIWECYDEQNFHISIKIDFYSFLVFFSDSARVNEKYNMSQTHKKNLIYTDAR